MFEFESSFFRYCQFISGVSTQNADLLIPILIFIWTQVYANHNMHVIVNECAYATMQEISMQWKHDSSMHENKIRQEVEFFAVALKI